MTNTITGKIDALMEQVAGACGDLVEHVTIDETEVKPPRGKVYVWVKPPEVAWPYAGAENELSVRLVFVAGSPWAQASALPVTSAEPVGFTRGDATLAAYQITLNEI